MIKPGRERSNEEIIRGLRELQGLARAGLLMTAKDIHIRDDAAERIERMDKRIEDLEERIDILMAELPDAGNEASGLIEEED